MSKNLNKILALSAFHFGIVNSQKKHLVSWDSKKSNQRNKTADTSAKIQA